MNSTLEHKLRLYSGLVIAFFLILHLLNAGLGIISLSVTDAFGMALFNFWSFPLFGALLYGSFIVHVGLMFVGLYRRRSLRMAKWNVLQYVLALALPILLLGHVLATRGAYQYLELVPSYTKVVSVIWSDPQRVLRQYALIGIAWAHMSIGLHYWLRPKKGYSNWVPVLYPLCLIIPLFASAGFLSAGFESLDKFVETRVVYSAKLGPSQTEINLRQLLKYVEQVVLWTLGGLLVFTLMSRMLRSVVESRRGGFVLTYASTSKLISGRKNQTVLEALREAGVPHAAVCGGRGRCTTCRIRVSDHESPLEPPELLEVRALKRISMEPNVRLACQFKPTQNMTIAPLLPADVSAHAARQSLGVMGREQQVVCLFVDMRDSTALGEKKLPYDVVFILNQFFLQLDAALRETKGHYATFNGDGLMALYGLNSSLEEGCRDALQGAVEIQRRIKKLNEWLKGELDTPLQIGMGIHCGGAIVGTMGPPNAPTISAIGDNINIAARLESLSKEYNAQLVISEDVLNNAGIADAALPFHTVTVRGREEALNILVVHDPEDFMAQVVITEMNSVVS